MWWLLLISSSLVPLVPHCPMSMFTPWFPLRTFIRKRSWRSLGEVLVANCQMDTDKIKIYGARVKAMVVHRLMGMDMWHQDVSNAPDIIRGFSIKDRENTEEIIDIWHKQFWTKDAEQVRFLYLTGLAWLPNPFARPTSQLVGSKSHSDRVFEQPHTWSQNHAERYNRMICKYRLVRDDFTP